MSPVGPLPAGVPELSFTAVEDLDQSMDALVRTWLEYWGVSPTLEERAELWAQMCALLEHSGLPITDLRHGHVCLADPVFGYSEG